VSIRFNADEIFEIAQKIECNGASFYRRAAGLFAGDVKSRLQALAAMEDEHEKTFAALRDDIPGESVAAVTFDPDNQAALYLQAVADGKVFDMKSKPEDILPEGISLGEVLDYAIGIEKESVVFYTGIKEMVPGTLGKDRIDLIIREEIGHIIDLRNQKAQLGL